MTTPYSFTIPNLTRSRIEAVRSKLSEDGFKLTGDQGSAKYKGVSFDYSYNEQSNSLSMTIVSKSPIASLFSDQEIESKVRDAIQNA
jgi:hypothetical protein